MTGRPTPTAVYLETFGMLALAVGALALTACRKSAPSASPSAGAAAQYESEPTDDFDSESRDPDGGEALSELESRLHGFEDELARAGVGGLGYSEEAAGRPDKVTDGGPAQCTRICELATAICGLETSICELASEHVGEARYDKACARVRSDCELAQEACDACGGS
ncbi:MAG: hypothetical protein JKY37_20605 [Nannocystaceae bacterium]|nr:hypothetical protein [Nannocystaceae bacterium]